MGIFKSIKNAYIHKDSDTFINYLRHKGIEIGNHCVFRSPSTTTIDKTRPALISIGNHVDMNRNFTIMTHDYGTSVFLRKYNDFINSSGKVTIGNNVYLGVNCTVLKGVTIGDNCIIGAHSLVTKNIPANSVAAGVPAKVISTLDEYYAKRKEQALEEAFEYARCIKEKQHKIPDAADFTEEFIYFVAENDAEQINRKYGPAYNKLIANQLQESYHIWLQGHHARFNDLGDFLSAAGVTTK